MGFFSKLKHSSIFRTFSNRSLPRKLENGEIFHPIGSSLGDNYGDIDPLTAFFVPEVNSVLNKRATAHSNIRLDVVSKSTFKPVNDNNRLKKLIKNPNWFQATTEFIKQTNIFRDLYGNEYIYLNFPFGFNPRRTKSLYSLSPANMDIKYKSDVPFYKETESPDSIKYEYRTNGKKDEINQENIIHLNDNRVDIGQTQNGEMLKGHSKIKAISRPISNIIYAYESRGVIIRNRGALGILSNNSSDGIGATLPIDDKEKQNLQNEYRNYGISSDQWQIIITSLSLKWQQMGIDVDKLRLFEEVREDAIKVAEAFNYPPELLGRAEGSANLFGDNKKEAEKNWYQDSIIPEAQERLDALNKAFKTDSESYTIVGKFDHLPLFQEDLKNKVSSMTLVTNSLSRAYTDGAITLDQYQSELMRYGFLET